VARASLCAGDREHGASFRIARRWCAQVAATVDSTAHLPAITADSSTPSAGRRVGQAQSSSQTP